MKHRLKFLFLIAALVLWVPSTSATELKVSIRNGANEIALRSVWSSYTAFWGSQKGSFSSEQFFAQFTDYIPIDDPDTRYKLNEGTDRTLKTNQLSANSFHQVVTFSMGEYYYVILSTNDPPDPFTVYPCFLIAFDHDYEQVAIFRG